MTRRLGLPIEYQIAPDYFDLHNIDPTTDEKNRVLMELLRTYNAKTVLDMTCGTGAQVFFLHQHGFIITGSDFSPALLKIARQKAIKQKASIPFIDGDMRTLNIGQFDAVITIANAIGHLTKKDFARTLKNIHSQLNRDGIYIFDILNLSALTDEVIKNFTMHRFEQRQHEQVHTIQYSTLNRRSGLLTSYDTWVMQKEVSKPTITKSSFKLQIYTPTELQALLEKNGFEVIRIVDSERKPFLENTSISMMIVARKKSLSL